MPPVAEESAPKKRKIRKGTTSCWECKRRKIRCQYSDQSHDICIGCQRRGTACRTQEYDDDALEQNRVAGKQQETEETLRRAETLLEQMTQVVSLLTPGAERLFQNRDASRSASEQAPRRSESTQPEPPSRSLAATPCLSIQFDNEDYLLQNNLLKANESIDGEHLELSRTIHALLPSQRDADSIISAGHNAAFLQFFTLPYKDIFLGRIRPASILSSIPSSSSHPILLARTLLYLANGLQNLPASTPETNHLDLECCAEDAMQKYLSGASSVTRNDQLTGSQEALECLILETVFHTNAGNLRCAWMVLRRAIGLAQLMGLHHDQPDKLMTLDPQTKASTSVMWHRILSQERYLALMLGLPATILDDPYAAKHKFTPEESPCDYLERRHSQIMRCITTRNESIQLEDYGVTQQIDQMLQTAAQEMPADWWLVPNTRLRQRPAITSEGEKLETILRILFQITHFNLLILLHFPYMLRSICHANHEYSRAARSNASRELLSRYIKFRCANEISFCCRAIDFSAFTACLSLLLAYIERWNHDSDVVDFLVHQRASDRALVEEVTELMLEVDHSNSSSALKQTVSIVKALLGMEADAASPSGKSSESPSADSSGDACRTSRCLRIKVPALGTINITRHGMSLISGQSACSTANKYVESGNGAFDTIGGVEQAHEERLHLQEHANLRNEGLQHTSHYTNFPTFGSGVDEIDWSWQDAGSILLGPTSGELTDPTRGPQVNCLRNDFFFSI
ncbi:uncharacterized protein BDZ83DRAFT_590922 [Colletotrichum acutatum]|uniref:Zn(2)-C6 fungal-type domain-containing protein n=1 Tax=Glomerella acutata TaxID=27357 RepID=A0AAD8UC26_GLOAC|nr:uncharacterized protein BDZ83DRAFT_590922 [Colletotrichum acutatum]KAK1711237.1 hypothetical protein BDZ83DRAFT_590922 [Colletotrichum acutatum]